MSLSKKWFFWVQGYKEKLWQIISLTVGA